MTLSLNLSGKGNHKGKSGSSSGDINSVPCREKLQRIYGHLGTSLVVQWLRLPFNARGLGTIPGQRTKIPCALGPKIKT